MNKILGAALVSGLVGFAAGNAFWYLASPLWTDVRVSETFTTAGNSTAIKAGTFRDADSVHRGKGTATVYTGEGGQHVARLTDFQVTNGPDLEVWLVANPNISSSGDVKNSKYVSLGQLKGNIGDQNYLIPANVTVDDYQSIVIWCEQFGVLFSAASLK